MLARNGIKVAEADDVHGHKGTGARTRRGCWAETIRSARDADSMARGFGFAVLAAGAVTSGTANGRGLAPRSSPIGARARHSSSPFSSWRPVDGRAVRESCGRKRSWARLHAWRELANVFRQVRARSPDEAGPRLGIEKNPLGARDLNPLKRANGMKRLIEESSSTHDEVAQAIGPAPRGAGCGPNLLAAARGLARRPV